MAAMGRDWAATRQGAPDSGPVPGALWPFGRQARLNRCNYNIANRLCRNTLAAKWGKVAGTSRVAVPAWCTWGEQRPGSPGPDLPNALQPVLAYVDHPSSS